MLAIENHDFTSNVDRLLRIVEVVDSPWFGVNFDSGNLSHSQDPYGDMERMAPFAVNAQVKVAINSAHGSQPANLKRVVEILRGAGYAGYLVLEYEAKEDPYTAIPRYVDQLRKLV
jgi:sugar phosphate isomerase/epimerase